MWWPNPGDCFWLFNEPDVEDREAYYGVPAVPDIYIDGKGFNLTSYDGLRAEFDERLAEPSPIRISNFSHVPYLDSVYVSFDLVAEDSVTGTDLRLFVVVSEWRNRCPFPQGAHDHVFRDLVPNSSGYSFVMEKDDSLHFDYAYYIDPEYNLDRIVTSVFIQKAANRSVHQAYQEYLPDYSGVEVVENPQPIAVDPNYPNPFSSTTRITYHINRAGAVRLSVYTPTGRLVTHIVDGQLPPGSHNATWDGHDRFGNKMGSGVYYYQLAAGEGTVTGKMMLLR